MLYNIDLPYPNQVTIDIINRIVKNHKEEHFTNDTIKNRNLGKNRKYELEKYYSNYNLTSVNCYIDDELSLECSKQYGDFFKSSDVGYSIVTLDNYSPHKGNSYLLPHVDRGRTASINLLLECGGDNVITTLYEQISIPEHYTTREELPAQYALPENLTEVCSSRLNLSEWTLFSTRNFHSVSNLESSRIILSITFWIEEFSSILKKYDSLLIKN